MANRIAATRVWGVYFSPTGTTRKIVTAVGEAVAASFSATGGKEVPFGTYDFTLPGGRIPECGGGPAGPGTDTVRPAGMDKPECGATEKELSERTDMPLPVSVPEGEGSAAYVILQENGGIPPGGNRGWGRICCGLSFRRGIW